MGDRRTVRTFDTTLRDGEQAPGFTMSPGTKLNIARHLDRLGVDVIEVGYPNSSSVDYEGARLISEAGLSARLCAFARAVTEDIEQAARATERASTRRLQILATASEFHLEHKRGITQTQSLHETRDALRLARSSGFEDVSLALEDSTRGSDDYLRALVEEACEAGCSTILVCDTVGLCLPDEFGDLVTRVIAWAAGATEVSVHCHDDLGHAVANTIVGLRSGATEFQATLLGIGERAGNASLEEVAAALVSAGDRMGLATSLRTSTLHAACQELATSLQMYIPRNKAVVGDNAFATEAGIHQSAQLKNPSNYEILDPADFGARRHLVLGRHSGRAAIRHELEAAGVDHEPGLVDKLYALMCDGRDLAHGDFALLVAEALADA